MHIFFVLQTVRIGAKVFMDMISGNDKRASAFRTCLYLLSNIVKDYYIAGPFLDFDNPNCHGLKNFLKKNNIHTFQFALRSNNHSRKESTRIQ